MTNKKLFVERESFETNGKTYFSYFIKGVVRSQEVKVMVCPPDKGGYAVLDLVFGDAMKADLIITPFEIKDEKTGRVVKGNTFAAHSEENGEVYECAIKPFRASDKAVLNMLLR